MKSAAGTTTAGRNENTASSTTSDGDVNTNMKSGKKAKKSSYEKQLEDINKELLTKASSRSAPNAWKGVGNKTVKLKAEQEVILLEQKCILLLKLKRNKEVVEDGYSILGRMGPLAVIYKCILIALVRLGRNEDDLVELLDAWKKAAPKCAQMLETRRVFDGYLTALRSGVKYSDIFSGVEDAIGLNANLVLSKSLEGVEENNKWRFRVPPFRHTAFTLCPRSTSGISCLYGDECLFAHSAEELKEWKMRVEGDKNSNTSVRPVEENIEEKDASRSATTGTAGKKLQIPAIYRSLLIPPLCVHYLLDLGKKIRDTGDIKKILTDEIPGVSIKASQLRAQRRVDGTNKIQCSWTFIVTSKMPMGTVTILHDANRDCFEVSSAIYYNKKKETVDLIDLHPNNKVQNKLQVLNTFIQPALFLRFNSGWPEFCYYKIELRFESLDELPDPGIYRQSLVFDFKKEPRVVKHIAVEILPKVEPIGSHLSEVKPNAITTQITKSVWGITPTPPPISPVDSNLNGYSSGENDDFDKGSHPNIYNQAVDSVDTVMGFTSRRSDFPSLTQCATASKVDNLAVKPKVKGPSIGNASSLTQPIVDPEVVVDSETGKPVLVKGVPLHETLKCDSIEGKEINLYPEEKQFSRENYCGCMQHFLDKEMRARKRMIIDFKKIVEFKILPEFSTSLDCLFTYQSKVGEVYGKIPVLGDIFAHNPKLERMILEYCCNIIMSSPEEAGFSSSSYSFQTPNRKFYCPIIEKSKSGFVVGIGRHAADELLLISNTTRQLRIQFPLESTYIDTVKCCLEGLSSHHLDLLFPNFDCALPFLKVIDGVGMQGEEERTLNSKQLNVYNLLVGRKQLVNVNKNTNPPILLLGGVSTGKSYLIAHCIAGLFRTSYSNTPCRRILLCTQSDFAADRYITDFLHNWLITDRLSVQKAKPLRICNKNRFVDGVSGVVKHYCVFDEEGTIFRYPTKEEVLAHKLIITTFSTCAELVRLGFDDTFSHIILDDVNQVLEAECIQPLILAGKDTTLVLAGDVYGLQSLSFSTSKEDMQFVSLLQRLSKTYPFRHPYVVVLDENYENHDVLIKFLSQVYYPGDQLRPTKDKIITSHPIYYPLTFHHIDVSRELQLEDGGGCYNKEEIRCIVNFIEDLIKTWPDVWGEDLARDKDSIVVFTPYHSQVVNLQVQLQLKGIHTVGVKLLSNMTGKKYKVVILSTVTTYNEDDEGLLDGALNGGFFTERDLLINAISCARNLVIAFGDAYSLWKLGPCSTVWKKYLTECHRNRSLKNFNPQPGKLLETEDGTIIGRPLSISPPKIQPLMSITGLAKKDPAKDVSNLERSQTTLIHTANISPSHGMDLVGLSLDDGVLAQKSLYSPLPHDANSWTVNASLNIPPKTDLFSAFYTNSSAPPLYTSPNQVNLHNFGPVKPIAKPIREIGPVPVGGQQKLEINKTVCRPVPVNGSVGSKLNSFSETKTGGSFEQKLSQLSKINANLYPSSNLEVYRTPFQLPSVSPTSILDQLPHKLDDNRKQRVDAALSSPPPIISPRPHLFDDHHLYSVRDRPHHPITSTPMKPCNEMNTFTENNLDSPFLSPLPMSYRGPPGFAPIATPTDAKLENLPVPRDPLPQQKAGFVGGVGSSFPTSKYSFYKKYNNNTYELPPRMLKHLNAVQAQTNYRSPVQNRLKPQSYIKPPPPPPTATEEMNFFEELGLTAQLKNTGRCDSCSTSVDDDDHSCIVSDETSSVAEDGDSNAGSGSTGVGAKNGWIEVKRNSKKSKRRLTRRAKNKAKVEFNRAQADTNYDEMEGGDIESFKGKNDAEMKMDDKIELITQMGFSTAEAINALQARGKDLQGAVDWLISKSN